MQLSAEIVGESLVQRPSGALRAYDCGRELKVPETNDDYRPNMAAKNFYLDNIKAQQITETISREKK